MRCVNAIGRKTEPLQIFRELAKVSKAATSTTSFDPIERHPAQISDSILNEKVVKKSASFVDRYLTETKVESEQRKRPATKDHSVTSSAMHNVTSHASTNLTSANKSNVIHPTTTTVYQSVKPPVSYVTSKSVHEGTATSSVASRVTQSLVTSSEASVRRKVYKSDREENNFAQNSESRNLETAKTSPKVTTSSTTVNNLQTSSSEANVRKISAVALIKKNSYVDEYSKEKFNPLKHSKSWMSNGSSCRHEERYVHLTDTTTATIKSWP